MGTSIDVLNSSFPQIVSFFAHILCGGLLEECVSCVFLVKSKKCQSYIEKEWTYFMGLYYFSLP